MEPMLHEQRPGDEGQGLSSFSHPRYFYGQRLDVRHFESEQDYFKGKMWLLNRLVSGCGVVCGLDVELGDDGHSVVVTPGVALDRMGREIVVPRRSPRVAIPPLEAEPEEPGKGYEERPECDDDWVHIVVCFKSCAEGPEPVLAGGCDPQEACAPGALRERYEIPPPRPGKARPIELGCRIPDLIKGNRINYAALAAWVSHPCGCPPADTCIPLANVRRPRADRELQSTDIDISVRPIVYTLDLLFELLLGLLGETQTRRGGKH
jgi:hypothetical protein